MVDKLISDLDVGTPVSTTEVEILLDSAIVSTRSDLSVVLALYDALTSTLTNKTFDANAAGNSLSNVENADVAAAAAIAFTKLAALTDGNILVGNASNVVVSVNPSGDINISNAGVFSIVAGVIVDADITDDTISLTKLVPGTKGEVIGTDGTTRQLLAVGTNDQVLTAASGETTGLKWAAAGAGGAKEWTATIPMTMTVPEGTVAFPDIHALATAVTKVSGIVLPDGAATSTLNFKGVVPETLGGTVAMSMRVRFMNQGTGTGHAVRLTLSTVGIAVNEVLDTGLTAETEVTAECADATETMNEALINIDLTTDWAAGDTIIGQLKRDPTDAVDDFAADILIVGIDLLLELSTD